MSFSNYTIWCMSIFDVISIVESKAEFFEKIAN